MKAKGSPLAGFGWAAVLTTLLSVALVACGGQEETAPTPTQAAAATPTVAEKAAWEIEWERTVAAAEQEGTLTYILGGSSVTENIPAFQAAYPKIKFEGTELRTAGEVQVRVPPERSAGKYLWDIYFQGGSIGVAEFGPKGLNILQDIRSLFILPELSDDHTWVGTLDDMWVDHDTKRYKMHVKASRASGLEFWVNRDLVPESVFNKTEDLLKPELKGKICSFDPTIEGQTDSGFAQIAIMYGNDFLLQLFRDTEMKITRDRTQLANDVVRGDCPIAAGPGREIRTLQREGVGRNAKPFQAFRNSIAPEWQGLVDVTCCGTGKSGTKLDGWLGGGANNTMLMVATQNPHPNATKVFVNWLLSREGGMAWQTDRDNACTRRSDLHGSWCVDKVASAGFEPLEENGTYISMHSTLNIQHRYISHQIGNQVFK